MEFKGIDVSYAQGSIQWPEVKKSGIDFAIIRLGYCYNDGQIKVDTRFHENMRNALASGMQVGVYVYSYALSAQAARRAAKETLELLSMYDVEYPVYWDIEDPSIEKLGRKVLTDTCIAFCDEVEKGGYYAGIYANKDWFVNKLDDSRLTAYDKWLAQWASKPTYQGTFGMWQYSSTGRVPGISGNVDLDIAYKDYPSIMKHNHLNKQ